MGPEADELTLEFLEDSPDWFDPEAVERPPILTRLDLGSSCEDRLSIMDRHEQTLVRPLKLDRAAIDAEYATWDHAVRTIIVHLALRCR